MGGDYRNGRDPGISRAAAAGATDSTSTWCSADSAKPVHLGLTAKGCLTFCRVSHNTGTKGLVLV